VKKKSEAWRLSIIAAVFLFLLASNNAFKTYLTKWAIDALTVHDSRLFYEIMLFAIFMLAISVPIEALPLYFVDKLSVSWRRWFNGNLLTRFLQNKAYYNIGIYSDVDNPDQRLAEDLNDFTQSSVTLVAKLGFSLFTLIAFIGVLWTISPWLVLSVILYATVGNVVVIWFMRILVKVNFLNIRYQADYRYNLIHVRDNVEPIAFYKGEEHEGALLNRSFHILIENFFRLIKIKRNIMFASKAYVLFSVIFPYVILAPRILSGKAPIGLLVQAMEVFIVILNDFSIIIEQFPELSTYAAKIQRLANLVRGMEAKPPATASLINYSQDGEFNFKNVTVETPDLKKTLVKNLDLMIKPGAKLIIRGPSGCGKSSLLRAVAGIWNLGQGEIATPNMQDVMFLPQRPYMLLGSLREQLVYPNLESNISDDELQRALSEVNLADLPVRVGGFETILKWSDILSLGEQQRIMFARLFLNSPKFAILDESTSALDEDNETVVYSKLQQSNITYVSVGHRSSLLKFHDHELLLDLNHGWQVLPVTK
jgi:putative ATP-binding cassette transporter